MERHIAEVCSVARSSDGEFVTIVDDTNLDLILLAITGQDLRRIVVI